jgi:hypothetical protein
MHEELGVWTSLFHMVSGEFYAGERMKLLREEAQATDTDLVIFRMLFSDYQKFQADQIKNRTT